MRTFCFFLHIRVLRTMEINSFCCSLCICLPRGFLHWKYCIMGFMFVLVLYEHLRVSVTNLWKEGLAVILNTWFMSNSIHEDGMWLPLWLDEKMATYAKISPKVVNPRDIAGNAKEEEEISHSYSVMPSIVGSVYCGARHQQTTISNNGVSILWGKTSADHYQ